MLAYLLTSSHLEEAYDARESLMRTMKLDSDEFTKIKTIPGANTTQGQHRLCPTLLMFWPALWPKLDKDTFTQILTVVGVHGHQPRPCTCLPARSPVCACVRLGVQSSRNFWGS